MSATSLDFSKKRELGWLATLVASVQAAAGSARFFLAGATARDLILFHGYGIHTGRETRDVDLAIMVDAWEVFANIRSRLLASGSFTGLGDVAHRLKYGDRIVVDLVPFGGIERRDRTIAWPPDGAIVMNVLGFREALSTIITVSLPERITVDIVSLAGLALLKLTAWSERRHVQPRKDAYDLALVLRHYLDAGMQERLYSEAAHLLKEGEFDYEVAGAWLLGRDVAGLVAGAKRQWMAELLAAEANPKGSLRLVGDMPIEPETGLRLLQGLRRGFTENAG